MILGYMFRHYFESWLDKNNNTKMRVIAVSGYLLMVFIPYFGNLEMTMIMSIFYQYAEAFVGIFTLVLFAKVVHSNRYINYVGQNTLIYFSLHGKVYSLIQTLLKKFVMGFYSMVLNNTFMSSVFCIVLSLILSVILIIPAYIINKYFPFIVGRKKR